MYRLAHHALPAGACIASQQSQRFRLVATFPHHRVVPYVFKIHIKRHKRDVIIAASNVGASDGASDGRMDKATIKANVDRAAAMLDQMLSTIMREMFVEQASAYVTDEDPELQEHQAIRNAVSERLEQLDANFLAALNVYIQMAAKRGEAGLLQLLQAVRDEVMHQVSARLPPAARVIERALEHLDKEDRVNVLRKCIYDEDVTSTSSQPAFGSDEGTSTAVDVTPVQTTSSAASKSAPGPEALRSTGEEVMTTMTQFIDDMEEQEVVADRRLLCRMVLLREEVVWLEQEKSFTQTEHQDMLLSTKFLRRNLPQRCIAFIKELLSVNDDNMRVGLLTQALSQDWNWGPASRPHTHQEQEQEQQQVSPQQEAVVAHDYIRPGRFMSTLFALEAQMRESVEHGVGKAAEQDPVQTQRILARLADIRMDAMAVMDRIQRGEIATKDKS